VDNRFIKQNGKRANSDAENASTAHSHFTKVVDRSDVPVDMPILNQLKSLPMHKKVWSRLESLPDKDEVMKVIQKMKNGKSAGITALTPDMIKVLPSTSVDYLTQVIRKNWEGELDCDELHIMKLTMLYKGKVKTGDPNNWRGIRLKELT
jgi:hypothetical protein